MILRCAPLLMLLALAACAGSGHALPPRIPHDGEAIVRAAGPDGDVVIIGIDRWALAPAATEVSGPVGRHSIAFRAFDAGPSWGFLGPVSWPRCPPPSYSATALFELQSGHSYEIRRTGKPSAAAAIPFAIVDQQSGATVWEGSAERPKEPLVCM